MLVDGGNPQANGFQIYLGNDPYSEHPELAVNFNGAEKRLSNPFADNQWHFVAATRNRSSGTVALYDDGTARSNSDTFLVDITGDEWADMAGEGTADTIRFAGRIDQTNSQFRKFEGRVSIATSELPLITNETGFEFWEDVPVEEVPGPAEPSEEEPAPPISEPLQHQLYLPVIGK